MDDLVAELEALKVAVAKMIWDLAGEFNVGAKDEAESVAEQARWTAALDRAIDAVKSSASSGSGR